MQSSPVLVVGAGPAGLTAAYKLSQHGVQSIILEKADRVGGISRTETYKGYRFDIGGHRFFTKVKPVKQLWEEVLGDDFIQVPRLSRIFYNGDFFQYPLEPLDVLSKIGVFHSTLMMASYMRRKLQPLAVEENLEQWVTNRFGDRLYETFFKTYTEKVWGVPCTEICADWAAQRIKGLSLKKAVVNALFGSNDTKTLIKEFKYPVLGPGMMWERFQAKLTEKGSPTYLNTNVIQLEHEDRRITQVIAEHDGQLLKLQPEQVISSMPVSLLLQRLSPRPPKDVLVAAQSLKYRDFLIVPLIVNQAHLFPDNWIYIHSPELKVGRIQNFKNWSPAMVPDPSKTCLGMEYFCNEGDALWQMSDAELVQFAAHEAVNLGVVRRLEDVEDGTVIRQHKAYPVYDGEYTHHLNVLQNYLSQFKNLQTVGRNGTHRYNNQDHSMMTGLMGAENILGGNHNLWNVNTERSYHEEFIRAQPTPKGTLKALPAPG
ncbi:MAG: NAD(P)/FAD-dependent oxidoreductase [Cyanobacteria bacterium J06639_14]